jgi:hypothetical protein
VNVTIPVAGLRTKVPSPATVTLLSASHVVLFKEYKHVANEPEVCNDVPVAKPAAPVTFVNDTVVPGNSNFV